MKTLFLVRHAKSSWDYPELDDIERPLNKRGKRDAPEMGKRLKKRGIFPDLMITSPAERAHTTCAIVADILDYPQGEIIIDEDVYHASEDILLHVLRNCENIWKKVMIFGHNPGFTDFANSIANQSITNIPTCGIFACHFNIDCWTEVDFGKGTFIFFDYPKKPFNP